MAGPEVWGPLMWKIIHTACEHLGKNLIVILQNDELNALNKFMIQVGHVIPCNMCRNHYKDYYKTHKKVIQYSEIKNYTKQYYYNLHDEINKERNIVSIPYDSLEETYKKITKEEFNILIKKFEILFQKYIVLHIVHPDAVRDFLLSLRNLRRSIYF